MTVRISAYHPTSQSRAKYSMREDMRSYHAEQPEFTLINHVAHIMTDSLIFQTQKVKLGRPIKFCGIESSMVRVHGAPSPFLQKVVN